MRLLPPQFFGAVALKPASGSGGERVECVDDSFWRKVGIEVPLAPELETIGIADSTRIMLELGQAGGPTPMQGTPDVIENLLRMNK